MFITGPGDGNGGWGVGGTKLDDRRRVYRQEQPLRGCFHGGSALRFRQLACLFDGGSRLVRPPCEPIDLGEIE